MIKRKPPQSRDDTRMTKWIWSTIFFIIGARILILPLVLTPDRLTEIEQQNPKLVMYLLVAGVVIFWGQAGRKTIENVLGRKLPLNQEDK
jgi:VIT1/CCC1 family predicted Fe2+/Mn2+ transporter